MDISAAFAQHYIDPDYDTYESRDELKQLGFRWDPEKKSWWHKDEAERDAAEGWLPMKHVRTYGDNEPADWSDGYLEWGY